MNAILLLALLGADASDYYGGAQIAATASDYYVATVRPKLIEEDPPKPTPKAIAKPAPAPARSGYPVRGSHWTFPGSNRTQLIHHLQSGEHAGKFSLSWLNSLSYQELLSLHDDDHEHRVKAASVNRPAAITDKERKKIEKDVGRVVYGTRDGKHPGPLGSAIRGFFGDPRYMRSGSGCPNGMCPNAR